MAFWRPGAARPVAPLSLEVDRETGDGGLLVSFNKNDALGLQQQRQRLPIFKVRDAILYLVETRATTVVVGARSRPRRPRRVSGLHLRNLAPPPARRRHAPPPPCPRAP